MVSLFPSAVVSTLQSCCLNRLDCTRSPHASLRFRGPRVTQSVAAPVALEYQGIRRSCHSSPPRLQSLTRLLDTYMASSRWVFGLPNVPHVSPQANVAARRCLGDRLISTLPWILMYPTPPVLVMASGSLYPFHTQYIQM